MKPLHKALIVYLITAAIALGAVFVSTMAHADDSGYMSGNTLLSRINSTDPSDRRSAVTYVMGVLDSISNSNGTSFCAPAALTAGQATDIARQFMNETPQHRHKSAALLVSASIIRAFPCSPGTTL